MKRLLLAALLSLLALPAFAASEGFVVSSCPGTLGVNAYTAGQFGAITVDVNGILCTSATGGSGGTSSNFGSAFPSAGTAIGFTDGTNMVAGKVRTPGSSATTSDAAIVVADPNVLAAINAPVPAGTARIGYVSDDPCTQLVKTSAPFGTAGATNVQVVAPVAAKKVFICSIALIAGAAAVFNVIEGTGAACVTANEAAIFGSTTAANGMSLAANGGFTQGNGGATVGVTATAANGVCVLASSSVQFGGTVTFVQQ